MGHGSRPSLKFLAPLGAIFLLGASAPEAIKVAVPGAVNLRAADLSAIRGEISSLERDLLDTKESQTTAANQLKKIRRLLALQQKEIVLSKKKIDEMSESLNDLSAQKRVLVENIGKQKIALRAKLRELHKITDGERLDASWLAGIDVENQKTYFLAKTLKKDLASVDRLKLDVQAALSLELRMIDERNKLDDHIQELAGQAALLAANEDVQKEIIRTNRASRLEFFHRIQSLKDSEREVSKMIASFAELRGHSSNDEAPTAVRKAPQIDVSLVALKGRLPSPVDERDGSALRVLSGFGRSYNPKTNLLTFQKGITLAASPAAEVRAVSPGRVAFSGPLKNYGLIVIVEHPGQYYTLYGQLGATNVERGIAVKQGDVLGRSASDAVYFEIRNKNVAVNPMQWISNASLAMRRD